MTLPAATTLQDAVEPGDMATPTDSNPIGFDDVPWLLDRAGAWLRAHEGGAKVQPTVWQRRDRHGWQSDEMLWRNGNFTLRTLGDDTTVELTESGCSVRAGQFKARCEPNTLSEATMAAALTGLAWPDGPGREAWEVEALHIHSAQSVYVRLVVARLHLRADLVLGTDGAVKELALGSMRVALRPDPDGFGFTRADGVAWHWNVQPPGGKEPFGRTQLRLDNSAGVDITVEAWDAAAKARGLAAMGPFSAEVDIREDGLRVRALQAPVLAEPEDGAWKGVQVVVVKQLPAESMFHGLRGDLVKDLRKNAKPGCRVAQLLGISPDEPEATSGEARRGGQIVVAVRPCP